MFVDSLQTTQAIFMICFGYLIKSFLFQRQKLHIQSVDVEFGNNDTSFYFVMLYPRCRFFYGLFLFDDYIKVFYGMELLEFRVVVI